MTRRTGRPRATYICGGEEFVGAAGVRLDDRGSECPNARDHAPMPAGYGAWHAVAELRIEAGQESARCPGCGLYRLAVGGKPVPRWPRRLRDVKRRRAA